MRSSIISGVKENGNIPNKFLNNKLFKDIMSFNKMFNSQKNVFWQALFVTVLIFGIGIVFGIILEDFRTGKVETLYQNYEISLMDIKLQTDIYSTGNFDCSYAIEENIKLADKIYNESVILDRYEKASTLKNDIVAIHKRYDLLRVNLLLNSIKIKQKCNSTYYDVVYIYLYNTNSLDIQARQNVFSKLLFELKQKKGNEILLIPIAGDNDLSSINIIMNKYKITQENLPAIIINGNKTITKLETIDDLLKNFK